MEGYVFLNAQLSHRHPEQLSVLKDLPEGQDIKHKAPTRKFQCLCLCYTRAMSGSDVSLPPACTSVANAQNYPNRASFHQKTTSVHYLGENRREKPTRLRQEIYVDLMREGEP